MNEIIPESMELPIKYPDPRAESAARAREFRRLTPSQRLRQIAEMAALGFSMVRRNPRRKLIEERWKAQRAEYQRIQQELFDRHGS